MSWADQLRIARHKVFLSLTVSEQGELEDLLCTIINKDTPEEKWTEIKEQLSVKVRPDSERTESEDPNRAYQFVSNSDKAMDCLSRYFTKFKVSNQENASAIVVYNKEELERFIPSGMWLKISVCPDMMQQEVFESMRKPKRAKARLNQLVTLAVKSLQDHDEKNVADQEEAAQSEENGRLYGRLVAERCELAEEKREMKAEILGQQEAFATEKEDWVNVESDKTRSANEELQREHLELQSQIDELRKRKDRMTKAEKDLQDTIQKLLDKISQLRQRNEKQQRSNIKILKKTVAQENTLRNLKKEIQDEREKVEAIKLENGKERQILQDLREKYHREEHRLKKKAEQQKKERIDMAVKRSSFHALESYRSRESIPGTPFHEETIHSSGKDLRVACR